MLGSTDALGAKMRGVWAVLIAGILLLAGCSQGNSDNQFGGTEGTESSDTNQSRILGRWEAREKGGAFLEFHEDGTVQGSTGCNGILTRYSMNSDPERNAARLEDYATTLRGCPDVDEWLAEGREVEFDDTQMTVKDHSGKEVGKLFRS
ncbi:META domain-containing protein [Brevibacterium sp. UMB1308A]|uniref:META domain-containing protein n=1 Tax=Brevibacterium sp. UMB1308A TaxID=3050608 RepID=UPI00254AA0C1|nr:META domain-containing protein [Brevibacterium sp. UMB1308A]MDK8713845.1 META domain-containing protein [Brevibacterium sp. UMB1308A]